MSEGFIANLSLLILVGVNMCTCQQFQLHCACLVGANKQKKGHERMSGTSKKPGGDCELVHPVLRVENCSLQIGSGAQLCTNNLLQLVEPSTLSSCSVRFFAPVSSSLLATSNEAHGRLHSQVPHRISNNFDNDTLGCCK